MIEHISIKDFAVIDNIDVDFTDGLSVITGETGSGKSILITAISLALGSRADSSYVRNGKDKAVVQLIASIDDSEIIISREITNAGKNIVKLNGEIVPLSKISEIASKIADIHGQYDNQSLLDPTNHLGIVDSFYKDTISPIKESYREIYSQYIDTKKELDRLLSLESDNIQKLDYLKYQITEIDNANLQPGEDETLENRLSILQNSEKIFASAKDAFEYMDGNSGAFTALGNALSKLEAISSFAPQIEEISQETSNVYYQLEDVSSKLRDLVEDLNYDPGEIDEIITRLNLVNDLKKKYAASGSIEDIIQYRNTIEKDLNKVENYDVEKEKLEKSFEELSNQLQSTSDELTKARLKSAYEIKGKILEELKDLNFDDADISVEIGRLSEPAPEGMDTAEIFITTNKGEPLKPLAKTSSGGELSRIMLAIKKITASYDDIPTLIFDEIDQGISGKTAAIVGRKLREIAESRQVISITHLPQIAAMGDNNYRIYKESDNSSTYTHVDRLTEEDKIMEIARLVGGEKITDSAIENAKELIANK